MITFHKTVLATKKYAKQIVQTVPTPAAIDDKIDQARAFLASRGIKQMKGLYGAPV